MDLTESAMWTLVEEAVIQDRGEDEEVVLVQVVRSYLARRGLADTLHTFDEEQRAVCGSCDALPEGSPSEDNKVVEGDAAREAAAESGGRATPDAAGGHRDHEVDRRKSAQLFCLQGRFGAAAALMPPTSLARIRLLCIQAQHFADFGEAVLFLALNVSPLVPFCANSVLGHEVYTATLSNILNPFRRPLRLDVEALAKEVNDELCGAGHPSSLDVLFNWAYWQETSA